MVNPSDSIIPANNTNYLVQFNPGSQFPLKLTGPINFVNWKAQVESLMLGHDIYGYLDGTMKTPPKTVTVNNSEEPNPKYKLWFRPDQLIRNALMTSVDPKITSTITKTSASKQAWDSLHNLYANKFHTRVFSIRNSLATIKKNFRSMTEYLREIGNIADELATAGAPILDDELHQELNQSTSSITAAVAQKASSNNFVPRNNKRGQPWRSQNSKQQYAPSYPRLQNASSSPNWRPTAPPQQNRPVCQLCGRTGRTANNLQHSDDYTGTEDITMGNSNKIPITHTCHVQINASNKRFQLSNILCAADIKRNIISVSQFCKDNLTSIEFLPYDFLVKDLSTGAPLARGQNKGLYE
uniref:Retrotransposon Copia-like N-terminal domain-containing protein n=1 Tax=Nicotiana tabacum TaxID=4097 RepID=A0A1S3ZCS4_TOBAC|nr:PREDICTED: uncharacterized protein LOC107785410 [Nicotiana tabacum]